MSFSGLGPFVVYKPSTSKHQTALLLTHYTFEIKFFLCVLVYSHLSDKDLIIILFLYFLLFSVSIINKGFNK